MPLAYHLLLPLLDRLVSGAGRVLSPHRECWSEVSLTKREEKCVRVSSSVLELGAKREGIGGLGLH